MGGSGRGVGDCRRQCGPDAPAMYTRKQLRVIQAVSVELFLLEMAVVVAIHVQVLGAMYTRSWLLIVFAVISIV